MKKVLITNCGPIMTGDIQQPTARGEVIWVEDGTIRYIGDNKPEFEKEADAILDAQGLFVSPSMIDAHCHMPMNDYLPQYKAVDVVENYMGGGISSMISQGPRMPGLPNSVRGAKALAIAGKEIWDNNRVRRAKVHGGALRLVEGLTEDDFREGCRGRREGPGRGRHNAGTGAGQGGGDGSPRQEARLHCPLHFRRDL